MTTLFKGLFAAAVAGILVAAPARSEEVSTTNLVSGNNAFALELYSRLAAGDGNVFFSPYSISTCLAMTYAGARGDTASQIGHVFHFDSDGAQLSSNFAELQKHLDELEQKAEVKLDIANGMWVEKNQKLLKEFTSVVRDSYGAEVKQADFRSSAEPTRRDINDWVSEKTSGKITDLLQPGVVNAATRLVLVNAIYLKGSWVHSFKKSATVDGPFSVSDTQKATAHFMHQDSSFEYAENEDCQLLEMPYGDSKTGIGGNNLLAMDILLPRKADGLKKLESSLTEPALIALVGKARPQKINVTFPKFTTTAQISLGQTLAAMGMPLAFSNEADFSGMDGERDLYISAIVHKAYVKVDESGTEAAAATGTVMALTSVMRQPSPVFRADHPFIFLIRDTQSGAILFLGRITDPTK
ncbi:MAG TPA: serpin family protein [Verrucomicrobiae bacterium]|jgi:serpin B|nr:serpin family protein [Verrucomicrobiae bacterium]